MVAAKKVPYEEVTETSELLEQATDQPIVVEFRGRRFRVVEEPEESLTTVDQWDVINEDFEEGQQRLAYAREYVLPRVKTYGSKEREQGIDPFADYDPEKALEGLRRLRELFKGVDLEALKKEIRIDRGHEPDDEDSK
jgi:hypothetical protein